MALSSLEQLRCLFLRLQHLHLHRPAPTYPRSWCKSEASHLDVSQSALGLGTQETNSWASPRAALSPFPPRLVNLLHSANADWSSLVRAPCGDVRQRSAAQRSVIQVRACARHHIAVFALLTGAGSKCGPRSGPPNRELIPSRSLS
jgi:hypothetical protein